MVFAALLAATTSFAAENRIKPLAASPHQIEGRLKSVQSLINTSSAALGQRTEVDAKTRAHLDEAVRFHHDAKDAFDSEDYEEAAKLLMESEKSLFKSVRRAGAGGRGMSEKRRRDYFNYRLKSARALLATHSLVAKEKKIIEEKKELEKQIEADIKKAIAILKEGDADKAISVLDAASGALKTSIRTMHKGDTKARLLDFETPADEYDFVKRFDDDYIKLADKFITEVVENRPDFPKLGRMKKSRNAGVRFREEAEAHARAGRYAEAIKTMDNSIKELKKVLRLLGFPIP